MKGWRRHGAVLVADFTAQEAALLRGLVGQLRGMLGTRAAEAPQDELAALTGIVTGSATAPEDRVLARLLPDFHRVDLGEDADAAGAMRSLHEPALIAAKDGVAGLLLATLPERGGKVRLADEQVPGWLAGLNDLRLALGTVLDVSEDMPDELPPDDPRATHLPVYHWLTWVQESLVQAVSS